MGSLSTRARPEVARAPYSILGHFGALLNLRLHHPDRQRVGSPNWQRILATMISRISIRSAARFSQQTCAARRTFAVSARLREANPVNVKGETTPETKSEEDSLGLTENAERGLKQAPNRTGIWSRSQKPRAAAMTGPRFEQTDFDLQVR